MGTAWAREAWARDTRRAQRVRAAFVANLTTATTSSRQSSQLVLGKARLSFTNFIVTPGVLQGCGGGVRGEGRRRAACSAMGHGGAARRRNGGGARGRGGLQVSGALLAEQRRRRAEP